jgi:hypothetical protein
MIRIKKKMRSVMGQERFSFLVLIAIEKDLFEFLKSQLILMKK